jgi:predicted PurR-regulated permease PerM
MPTEVSAGDATELSTRRARIRGAAAARGIPLAAIITAVAVVALTFLAGKLLYRLRDVILLMVVAGFIALILNPLVLYLQHRGIRRRGWAVAVVTIWAALVFAGLAVAFGHPLALWVALVDFLPQVGGALAGIPTVLFALGHSLTAGIVTAAVFIAYQQVENHVLNPVIMSRTVKVNPLLILVSVLVGASIGDWVGGFFGSFVAALLAIPTAGALQIVAKELWRATGPGGPLDDEPAGASDEPASQAGDDSGPKAHRRRSVHHQEAGP